jgi:dipeptidyl aminopeptidase/acylaminoacyl peptidase
VILKKISLIGATLGLAALSFIWWRYRSQIPQPLSLSSITAEPTVSPDPFADLTIPYLRNRTYQSQLGELRLLNQQAAYTSYLTSYESDGLKINGLLTQPKGEMPTGGWPAIVFIHGYIPPTTYRTTEKYVDYINYLARNGFVVFKIDLRGHGDSEGEPGGAYNSGDYVIDTLNARAALQQSEFVNPAQIGLWGHSMAGNVVFRSLAAQPAIPAAVIWAGAVYSYTDMQKYGLNDNSYRPPVMVTQRQSRRQALTQAHGNFSASDTFWQQVAATNYLSEMRTPIQIHHAVDDTVVNIGYSRDLMQLLDGTAIPHELFEYRTGGHNISGPSYSQAMQRTVDFFKTHLEK